MRTIPDLKEGTHRAVTTGSLPNGKPVVVNADGTVSVVAETSVSTSIPAGSEAVFNNATTTFISAAFDPNTSGKFVVAYRDSGNSYYGTAIVGTISGTAVSFGSESVFNSAATTSISVSFDPNTAGKFVVVYQDDGNSSYGTAIAGTVSGTNISFGSERVYNTGSSPYNSIAFDPNTANKFIVAFQDGGNAYRGKVAVGTISGTSLSFGSEYLFNPAATTRIAAAFDPNTAGKFVVAYMDDGNSNAGTAIVGTVSGTTASFGSEYAFNYQATTHSTEYISLAFDPNTAGKFVVAYKDAVNSNYGTATVGTVSGTAISYSTKYVFNSGATKWTSCAFDSNIDNTLIVAYMDDGALDYGKVVAGTLSGGTLLFGSEYTFHSGATAEVSLALDANTTGKFVVAYQDFAESEIGKSVVGQIAYSTTNLTSENYIGISTGGTYADGSSATVDIIGTVNEDQSGLTAGQSYYVQTDGTIATTPATPEVFAGTAISATSLVVKT